VGIFFGDILCPLLKQSDYKKILNPDVVFLDANNRFSFPNTNHWSLTSNTPQINKISEHLVKWKNSILMSDMIKPHGSYNNYFDSGVEDLFNNNKIPYSIFDFTKVIQAKNAGLVHYSGKEDLDIYNEKMLNESDLLSWINQQSEKMVTNFFIPKVGDVFNL